MRKIISWIVLAPLFVVLAVFAVSNREAVVLKLWPTPFELTAPVFLIGLGGLFLGFLWGAVVVWFAGGEARGRARRATRQAEDAERRIERLKTEAAEAQARLRNAEARLAEAKADPAGLPAVRASAGADLPRII